MTFRWSNPRAERLDSRPSTSGLGWLPSAAFSGPLALRGCEHEARGPGEPFQTKAGAGGGELGAPVGRRTRIDRIGLATLLNNTLALGACGSISPPSIVSVLGRESSGQCASPIADRSIVAGDDLALGGRFGAVSCPRSVVRRSGWGRSVTINSGAFVDTTWRLSTLVSRLPVGVEVAESGPPAQTEEHGFGTVERPAAPVQVMRSFTR
jgi:hypothetical protein